jgi:hypothetical protein
MTLAELKKKHRKIKKSLNKEAKAEIQRIESLITLCLEESWATEKDHWYEISFDSDNLYPTHVSIRLGRDWRGPMCGIDTYRLWLRLDKNIEENIISNIKEINSK